MEFRVFGPPGTGKTTYISAQIKEAVLARGPDKVLVASFTKAAAHELVSRGLPVPKHAVGTLHSLCWHVLGAGLKLATDSEVIRSWNEPGAPGAKPGWGVQTTDDPVFGEDLAFAHARVPRRDEADFRDGVYYNRVNTLRNKHPLEATRVLTRESNEWYEAWCDWKREVGAVDFCDLIEITLRDGLFPRWNPEVGFFDEVQDFSPLELALVRQWGSRMDRFILAGDDDQAIYFFRGSVASCMITPDLPATQKRYLRKSFRVPSTVLAYADHWIRRVAKREEKVYEPRDAIIRGEGGDRVGEDFVSCCSPVSFCDALLTRHLEANSTDTIAVLAPASYQLQGIIRAMRSVGIPYHNPYRARAGHWNPMRGLDRVASFLHPHTDAWGRESRPWLWEDLWHWIEMIDVKRSGMNPKMKQMIHGLASDDDTRREIVPGSALDSIWMAGSPSIAAVRAGDVEWLERMSLSKYVPRLQFANAIIKGRGGKRAITQRPRVVVGTIHSVKGAGFDYVILDSSGPPAMTRAMGIDPGWGSIDGYQYIHDGVNAHDAVVRTYYVGMTRARQGLYIADATDPVIPPAAHDTSGHRTAP